MCPALLYRIKNHKRTKQIQERASYILLKQRTPRKWLCILANPRPTRPGCVFWLTPKVTRGLRGCRVLLKASTSWMTCRDLKTSPSNLSLVVSVVLGSRVYLSLKDDLSTLLFPVEPSSPSTEVLHQPRQLSPISCTGRGPCPRGMEAERKPAVNPGSTYVAQIFSSLFSILQVLRAPCEALSTGIHLSEIFIFFSPV